MRHQTPVGAIFSPSSLSLSLRLTCPMQPLVFNVGVGPMISRGEEEEEERRDRMKST